jgi:hypothetical protein
LSRNENSKLCGLKVIVLSTLTTWGGKCYSSPIIDHCKEFKQRVPLASSFYRFTLENMLQNASVQNKINLCIVGTGLFYGEKGLDLFDSFRFVWFLLL